MPRVLILEPHDGLRDELVRAVRAAGYAADAVASRADARARTSAVGFDAALVDVRAGADLAGVEELARPPRPLPVLATGAAPSVELAVEAMKRGARDFLRKPFAVTDLEGALASLLAGPARERGAATEPELLTADPAMERLLRKAEAAAATEATVQIVGESGTGKELLARFVHRRSPRRSGPFVAVNCAALPPALAESELFGHEPGAFTDAREAREGQVAAAAGGTLLLDEVSDAAPALQPKLLRVLQEREVLPVGGLRARPVDVRLVCTTQRDLAAEVEAGRFREDLYYRLDVIVLRVPPLRERPADVPLLARSFARRFAEAAGSDPPLLGERALARLVRHPFRGNVRELANLMRRAAVLCPGRELDAERLLGGRPAAGDPPGLLGGSLNLRDLERRAIVRCLAGTGGNRTEASRALGISVRTLRNKIRQYGLR